MSRRILVTAALGLTGVVLGLVLMGQGAFSKNIYHDDTVTTAYWGLVHKYGDTYKADDLSAHFRRKTVDPIPYYFYKSAAPIIDPYFMPTIFAAISSALVMIFGYFFGFGLLKRESSPFWLRNAVAIAFAMICLTIMWNPFSPICGVGNGGDFLLPILLGAMIGARKKSLRILTAALFFAAGTYPSAFLLVLALAGFTAFNADSKKSLIDIKIVLAFLLGVAILFILRFDTIFAGIDPAIGSLKTMKQMIVDPNFHWGGRHPVWVKNWAATLLISYQGGLATTPELIMSAILLLFIYIFRRRKFGKVDKTFYLLFLSCFSLYFMSWIYLAKLFYPSRYLRGALPIIIWGMAITGLANWIGDKQTKKTKIATAALSSVFLLIPLFTILFFGGYRYTKPHKTEIALCNKISSLPQDTLIAGHPWRLDPIIYLGRRSVLTSFENLMPVFTQYHKEHSKRTDDVFAALYATEIEEVIGFCEKYDVTHLLIHTGMYRSDYKKKNPYLYPRPFNEKANYFRAKGHGGYVLNRPSFPGMIYRDSSQILVPCSLEAFIASELKGSPLVKKWGHLPL